MKYSNIPICKKDMTLGFVSANYISEIKRIIKKDESFKYRNHGIITICFSDRDCINVNSNI